MIVSVNPTYLCNLRCASCYLTPEQLSDKTKIALDVLVDRLNDIVYKFGSIEHIDVYGGEITMLPDAYVHDLLYVVLANFCSNINIVTNFTNIKPYLFDDRFSLTVSYDFHARQQHEKVLTNMKGSHKEFSILILANDKVMSMDPNQCISILNDINRNNNVASVEIKPYSPNQSNHEASSYIQYEQFVLSWINSRVPKIFYFINETRIIDGVRGQLHSWSDDHLYITPTGKFAVLSFDEHDREYFDEFEDLSYYDVWVAREKEQVNNNKFCSTCQFNGHCLSEHLRDVKSIEHSCNGGIKILTLAKAGELYNVEEL